MSTVGEYINTLDVERLKPALIPHGGGMLGTYSIGALATLQERALLRSFKYVIGGSSGAINGAYALAEQAEEAIRIYVDTISNKKFINLLRVSKIVNVDFLVDEALKQVLPLNIDRLRAASTELHVVLTNADTGQPEIVTNRDDVDFYEVIRATGALPGLYNRRVELNGQEYVDGGIANFFPVDYALELGSKAILGIVTWPEGYRNKRMGHLYRKTGFLLARGQSKAIKSKIGVEDKGFNDALDIMEGVKPVAGIQNWVVRPSDPASLAKLHTIDRRTLQTTADMGRRDMETFLDQEI